MHFFIQVYRGLKPCTALLENVSLRVPPKAILGTSHYLVFVPLLGAPMLTTRLVKISTYLQSEQFLSIIFILINLNILILCIELNYYYYYYYILMYLNLNSFFAVTFWLCLCTFCLCTFILAHFVIGH
jgi:hypothetical protein